MSLSQTLAPPGLEGVAVTESRISFVDGQRGILEYRGININDLAGRSNFEGVSFLLLKGEYPSSEQLADFDASLRQHRALSDGIAHLIQTLPPEGHPMDALQATVAAAGMFYPCKDVDDSAGNWQSCIRLIAKLPTMVANFYRLRKGREPLAPDEDLSHADNFLYMLTGQKPDPRAAEILDACLILHAEHTMNASTFSARVVGSTLADPFAVISSAIGTLSGPLHGGANEKVIHLLREIGAVGNVERIIEAKMSAKEKIMGFGHRVYKTNDPRALILRDLADELLSDSDMLALAKKTEEVVTSRLGTKGIYANVDFYSGLVYDALGIDTDLFTPVFAIARVAGWLAHWLEQLHGNRIYRPRQIYTGSHGVAFDPAR